LKKFLRHPVLKQHRCKSGSYKLRFKKWRSQEKYNKKVKKKFEVL